MPEASGAQSSVQPKIDENRHTSRVFVQPYDPGTEPPGTAEYPLLMEN
jgi:hypothetical protein